MARRRNQAVKLYVAGRRAQQLEGLSDLAGNVLKAYDGATARAITGLKRRAVPIASRAVRANYNVRARALSNTFRAETGRDAALDSYAKEAGLSRAHFFRLFESSIGVPPKVYLNVVRMERAVDAVLNQSASVCDISNQLGFAEPAHFTRFFRNHAGVGPREFRAVSRLAS